MTGLAVLLSLIGTGLVLWAAAACWLAWAIGKTIRIRNTRERRNVRRMR